MTNTIKNIKNKNRKSRNMKNTLKNMKGGADDDLAHVLILKTIKPGLLTYFKDYFNMPPELLYQTFNTFVALIEQYNKKKPFKYIHEIENIIQFCTSAFNNSPNYSPSAYYKLITITNDNFYKLLKKSLNLTYDLIIKKLYKIVEYQNAPASYFCMLRNHICQLFKGIADCINILIALFMLINMYNNSRGMREAVHASILKNPVLFNEFLPKEERIHWWNNKRKNTELDDYIRTLYVKLNKLLTLERDIYLCPEKMLRKECMMVKQPIT